jgi:hypothetical protein
MLCVGIGSWEVEWDSGGKFCHARGCRAKGELVECEVVRFLKWVDKSFAIKGVLIELF